MSPKRLILSAVGLLVVVLVLPMLALQYVNWDNYRSRVAGWLGSALEREVTRWSAGLSAVADHTPGGGGSAGVES